MDKKSTKILGISAFYHDSAAALLIDGKIIAAAQEERFTRVKHDDNFPRNSVIYCLQSQGFTIRDIDYVVFYDKPILKFERLLRTYINTWPRGLKSFIKAMKVWLSKKVWTEHLIAKELSFKKDILFTEHHYAHAASAYYSSQFDDAVIVTMDGVGEWDTTTIGFGNGNQIKLTKTIHFPHSLGLLYSALTYYLGFKVNSAEYKVMGLAPYGNPDVYYNHFKKLITIAEDGSFELNMKYFPYEHALTMTNIKFNKLFESPPRKSGDKLEQKHKDIAATLQKITEEIVLKIVRHAHFLHPSENLCLAGGVALNCVANGKILKEGLFKRIFIQPASGDAGGAIGAASYAYFEALGNEKCGSVMDNVYLGPEFSNDEIKAFLEKNNKQSTGPLLVYRYIDDAELFNTVADLINDNAVIGWFQGRMEFGPRSLGNRSILADARKRENWQRVNLKIKHRESFRPFAPSVLAEEAEEYFDLGNHESPYMLLVAQVKDDTVPAVTHVDKSARIQTVTSGENSRYYNLLRTFYKKTGCPVMVNTSFNVRGEPIVCTLEDAFNCFTNTEMDYLVLGNYLISKEDNPSLKDKKQREKYLRSFELD